MSRQLFAIALLLGGIVVAIVHGQDPANEQSDEPSSTASVSDEYDDAWSESSGGLAAEKGKSRYSVAQAAADDEDDGMHSVLKNPPRALPGAADRDEAVGNTTSGSYSSRRSTPAARSLESNEQAAEKPILTARANKSRSRGTTQPTSSAATSGLQLKSVAPMLHVDAIGPEAITVGKPSTYRVLVANDGSEPARDVVVSIAVPAAVDVENMTASAGEASRDKSDGSITWTLPSVNGGAQQQVDLQLTAREDHPFTLGVDWTMRCTALSATVQVQKPALAVRIEGPDEILFGEQKVFTIVISNPGTGPAENVSLDVSTGGGGQARQIGTIAPGGQEQIGLKMTAREAGSLEIAVNASAEGLHEEAKKSILVRRAELAVEITGPEYKFAGTSGSYQIDVTNKGNAPATDVAMSLRLPAGVRYMGGLDQATEAAGRLTWALNELAIDDEQSFTVSVQYEKAGALVTEISATGAGDLTAAAQCETQVEAIADLAMTVSDPPGPSAIGEEISYEIRITNRGSKAAEAVEVVGQFAEGIEPIRVEGHAADVVTGQAVFKPIPRIEPGQTLTLKIVARADRAGNHRFRAVLKCADPDTELVAEEMTRFFGDDAKSAGRKSGAKR